LSTGIFPDRLKNFQKWNLYLKKEKKLILLPTYFTPDFVFKNYWKDYIWKVIPTLK
jgi:hypothetical protein